MPRKTQQISKHETMMTLAKTRKLTALKRRKNKSSSVNINDHEIKWLTSDEVTAAFNSAVQQEIARKKKKGIPIARYDIESQRAYLENADGTREYV